MWDIHEAGTVQFSGSAGGDSRPDIGGDYSDPGVTVIKPGGCKLVAQGPNLAIGGVLDIQTGCHVNI